MTQQYGHSRTSADAGSRLNSVSFTSADLVRRGPASGLPVSGKVAANFLQVAEVLPGEFAVTAPKSRLSILAAPDCSKTSAFFGYISEKQLAFLMRFTVAAQMEQGAHDLLAALHRINPSGALRAECKLIAPDARLSREIRGMLAEFQTTTARYGVTLKVESVLLNAQPDARISHALNSASGAYSQYSYPDNTYSRLRNLRPGDCCGTAESARLCLAHSVKMRSDLSSGGVYPCEQAVPKSSG